MPGLAALIAVFAAGCGADAEPSPAPGDRAPPAVMTPIAPPAPPAPPAIAPSPSPAVTLAPLGPPSAPEEPASVAPAPSRPPRPRPGPPPRSTCPPGTCRIDAHGPCERPTGQHGNMCCGCTPDGRCAMRCRCNGPDVPVATPAGPVRIADLRVGDTVVAPSPRGPIAARIVGVIARVAPRDGYVRVVLDDGTAFVTSAVHPLADGRDAAALAGDPGVRSIGPAARPADVTYDVLTDGACGGYFVGPVAFGSTLGGSIEACR